MPASEKIRASIERSSWIRKMFEEGMERKAKYGAENVFDFSLGNPDLEPPASVGKILGELVKDTSPGTHAYMPNAGLVETRQAVADYLNTSNRERFTANEIVMTVGAGGGLNVVLKTILNPQEEVIIPSPYFVEYNFYLDNHQGIPKVIPTHPDFSLNLDAIAEAISEKTRAVLMNSPNNPTGRVYTAEELAGLTEVLTHYSAKFGQPIYLISDEPYRKIVYDGITVPSVFDVYRESFVVTSFSKDLSLPGEHQKRRDIFCEGLASAGYDFEKPQGAFYLFPRSPIEDDAAFVRALQEENILTVPGSGFGGPGHFRIAYCVEDKVIERALPGFKRVMAGYR
ncbi:MAG: aminotransferase class I/II-fold pyridoxal phosphate-dependent enzyme [Deltaproteobacteria bacterium]